MTYKEKIDYMIQTLQVALDELNYINDYSEKASKVPEDNYNTQWYFVQHNRTPNMTLVRENLKTVGRFAYIVEKEIPKKYL